MKQLFTLLCAMFLINTAAQNSVSGKITDAGNQQPLEQVSVYFPELGQGAVTNSEGEFQINNLPTGSYKLIVSYIGYLTYSKTFLIEQGSNRIDLYLTASAIEMEEVIVSTPFHKLQRENVMKVEQARLSDLKTKGAVTLSEGITNIPGVSSVSTGLGIGKPVIRGLSANRVLVYSQGIRLENQQFGDEHGLGLDEAGIESVEVIKGPASLLYGSDALGGVLYLNPERFALSGTESADLQFNYFSNTSGLKANAGFKSAGKQFKYLIRTGYTSHADYKTGAGMRVTNSRFNSYDLKTGIGYQQDNFRSEIRYNYNNSDLGLPEEIGVQTTERTPDLPAQELHNHILSSTSHLFLDKSSIKLTLGYVFNNRMEFEEDEGPGPALQMKLSTMNYNLQYQLPKTGRFETIVGLQGMLQTNKNFGEEILIPDARTNDIGVLGTSHLHFDKSDLQFGLRYDHRDISGEQHGILGAEDFIAALDRNFNSFNLALGYRIDLSKNIIGRVNIASGFRAPNLAELTSNGVHEGTNRFEIGNPGLENEKNLQTDIALEYKNEHFEFYVNGFYNSINDYIFIQPSGTQIGEDPVFIYQQQDAQLYGGELGLHIHPHPLDWLHLESSYETVTGKTADGANLPLIPANSFRNSLRVELVKNDRKLKNGYAYISVQSVLNQDNISSFETPTKAYNLLNLGLGGKLSVLKKELDFRISANNVLNENYISHLSRLKTDGIANIGRNISAGISVQL